ncbi:MAG: glycosyltransferase [Desulfarculus sp.]|nr:MAG: glycosyltransferase [Desulfarculus sp.]
MRAGARVAVVIPAYNEERAIGRVLAEVPAWVDQVIVADNGSTDATARVAVEHGAQVVPEPRRGYGAACLAGLAALGPAQVVVFLDGDYSDFPRQMQRLVDPILAGRAELVIGSRVQGRREPGALAPQARWGNWLACLLLRLFWGARFTDLGPFRAVRREALARLGMSDRGYGWTVEMQLKAARLGLACLEVPVDYRRRIGLSHVSGTLRGVLGAGAKILYTIFKYALRGRPGGRG